jgi:hypothetical protein
VRLDADQLEWVVREVVRRLQTSGGAAQGGCELAVGEKVVTMQQIEGKLAGVDRLRVPQEAVVTPAVHDLLKSKNVQLHRGPA